MSHRRLLLRSAIVASEVLPPIGKQKQYPQLTLTVLHAQERDAPQDREGIDWKLITDLPVRSCMDAIEKLDWYAMRWKIETFHKVLKSGCKAEESRLRTAERLVNLQSCGNMSRAVAGSTVYRDEGQSGAKNERPTLTALLNDLRRRKADVVVVWALDRLARSLKHYSPSRRSADCWE